MPPPLHRGKRRGCKTLRRGGRKKKRQKRSWRRAPSVRPSEMHAKSEEEEGLLIFPPKKKKPREKNSVERADERTSFGRTVQCTRRGHTHARCCTVFFLFLPRRTSINSPITPVDVDDDEGALVCFCLQAPAVRPNAEEEFLFWKIFP